ncbi:MAG: polysaccharide deacetylase family protein [Flavobacteriales bacterium]|jgi:peptidoglycan/xylan/chitin deacetylase (PgdA/CDA1 family)
MYLVKTPSVLQPLVNDLLWSVHTFEREVFLTFDDGPTPQITERTLDLLAKHNAKATFFCLGKNVDAHPEIFERIIQEGHTIGNHTHDHLNGRKTSHFAYLRNIAKAEKTFASSYFRPPYGKITRAQIAALKSKYRIVMWDIITGDFDPKLSAAKVLKNVVDNVQPGSIIVFHDSIKAAPRMLPALEETLLILKHRGYKCSPLPALGKE